MDESDTLIEKIPSGTEEMVSVGFENPGTSENLAKSIIPAEIDE